MEENPYEAPGRAEVAVRWRRPSLRACLMGIAVSIAITPAVLLLAAIVAFFAFPYFVDIRENPVYWDEIERHEKMGMTREEAAKAISEERRAREQDAQ